MSGEPSDSSTAPTAQGASQHKRKRAYTLSVASWASVVGDRRQKHAKLLEMTPGIVSLVDQEREIVHLLYPNMITECLNRQNPGTPLLFTVEAHPLAKVREWQRETRELDGLLQRVLLAFVEQRGQALRLGRTLKALDSEAPIFLDSHGLRSAEDPEQQAELLKLNLGRSNLAGGGEADTGEAPGSPVPPPMAKKRMLGTPPADAASEATPQTPQSGSSRATPAATPRRRSLPEALKKKAKAPVPQSDLLKDFTAGLSRLFAASSDGRLSFETVQNELAASFPEWQKYLADLDAQNKVLVAEQVVFQI